MRYIFFSSLFKKSIIFLINTHRLLGVNTEQELIELGLSKELALKVSSASLKEIDEVKNSINNETLSLKKQISERESQITELKKI